MRSANSDTSKGKISPLPTVGPTASWIGFTLALKGVFLEGLEVVFIVIAVGGTSGGLHIAVAGGLLAMIVVAAAGFIVKRPLARVPDGGRPLVRIDFCRAWRLPPPR